MPPSSALATTKRGHDFWTTDQELAALALHAAQVANWQRQGTAAKKSDYPKPYRRPWESDDLARLTTEQLASPEGLSTSGIIGNPIEMSDARERLFALNGRAPSINGVPDLEHPAPSIPADPFMDALEAALTADLDHARAIAALLGYPFPGRMFA